MNTPILHRLSRWAAAAALGSSLASAATTSIIQGGDPGEGLDLQGNFLYAVNVGANGAAGQVGDANFTADNVTGVSINATDSIAPWGALEFGGSAADNNLEKVVGSIRHMGGNGRIMQVTLQGLQSGADYKLQLLFREQCCMRGFDILVNGATIVDDFNPGTEQGGVDQNAVAGCAVTHEFTASAATLEIKLDPTDVSPDITDFNPILSGFTLERLSAVSDNDADGLPDDWEIKYFSNLDQNGTGDPDQDNLTNAQEVANKTDPTKKDTDGDTLNDDTEVLTHKTDPTKKDTDGDGINDNVELATTRTDPLKPDTDGDTWSDYDELRMLTDPLNANNYPEKTTFTIFTGGDAGEGLDLDGNFLYAINVGPDGAAGQIRDANFTEDTAEGVTIVGGNNAGNWHTQVNLGDSPNDAILNTIMSSIRWSDANNPTTPTLRLTFAQLEAGAAYKLQLLFAEEGWPRGFDVTVDGRFIADDFSPWHYQGGFPKTNGVVLTYKFIASTNAVDVILDGRTVKLPEFTDHNPILQGATLELTAENRDTDSDGLPDPWEIDQFGNLSQTAAADPDADMLTNLQEFGAGTNPQKADTDADSLKDGEELNTTLTNPLKSDTDADGLTDGDEVKVHHSDPTKVDTDDDGLPDGAEVNQYHTDPTKTDSDGDTFNDYDELRVMTNPSDAGSRPAGLPMSAFTGADAGEGLDLDGQFVYALNIGPDADPPGQIRDANFTADTAEGVTITGGNTAGGWHDPDFGQSEADQILNTIMSSIRWSDVNSAATPNLVIQLGQLQAGTRYKLQLLFAEHAWPRGFDVFVNNQQLLDDFSPRHYQGGYDKTRGVVVTQTFVAVTTSAEVRLDGRGVTAPEMADHNAAIQALTLENLGPAPVDVHINKVEVDGTGVRLTVGTVAGQAYALQYRASLTSGSWQELAPVNATGASTVLTDNDAAHRSGPTGFWRVAAK